MEELKCITGLDRWAFNGIDRIVEGLLITLINRVTVRT